jgi:hypothetical protein
VYHKKQRKQWKKIEEEERLAWEVEQQRRRNDPKIWEYHIAKAEENNKPAREAEREETTSETWPLPRPEEGTFLHTHLKTNGLKGFDSCIFYLLCTTVPMMCSTLVHLTSLQNSCVKCI